MSINRTRDTKKLTTIEQYLALMLFCVLDTLESLNGLSKMARVSLVTYIKLMDVLKIKNWKGNEKYIDKKTIYSKIGRIFLILI